MINYVVDIIIILCLIALFTAIIINFFEVNNRIEKQKKSIVETGSMTGFFIVFYLLIRFKIGHFEIGEPLSFIAKVTGLLLMISGTYINIKGRSYLGKNWANQVTIYTDQKLIISGPYKYIRHPLYGSIMYMFYGACLIYSNYAAFLCTTFIFIPFMYYRARQEEKLLMERFSDYDKYKTTTGMFFPKIIKV
jgi:protein-S-isoprenylcysteine O-methyltransferase Ste14